MSLSLTDQAWIEDRITHDPALQDRLLACGGPAEAAALIVALAQAQNVPIDEAALRAHFLAQADLALLDDAALETVSGGLARKFAWA